MGVENADFSGYVTKAGIKCADGRTIKPEAFAHMDGIKVPLVWQHGHKDPKNVLGHVILEKREDGLYGYAFTNETEQGVNAKALVQHGDIDSFSIWANKLVERAGEVFHGMVREVSLAIVGANEGAKIDNVRIAHSADPDDVTVVEDEAFIEMGIAYDGGTIVRHSEESDDHLEHKTIAEIVESFTDEQMDAVGYMLTEALKKGNETDDNGTAEHSDNSKESDDSNDNEENLTHSQEGPDMSRNVFETHSDTLQHSSGAGTGVIQHASGTTFVDGKAHLSHAQVKELWNDGIKMGSFKESLLAHAQDYGITNIEVLFPDAKAIDNKPEWITRKMEWVETVLNGARKLPFSKIKSLSADLTHDEARAKGYIKGNMKKEQFFQIAHRETGPTTVYKKQKLDRDDLVDVTDFDIVAWLWVEIRFMVREEVARAVLIGDGREIDDPDKIDEQKIRPIARDDEFYTDLVVVPGGANAESTMEAVLRARPRYKGEGLPTAFMTEDFLTDMLLLKDKMNRRLYQTTADVAAALRVSSIVPVPVLEGARRDEGEILIVLVNMSDYSIGATKGGELTQFDDFDIDFNQYKYLLEGRMSGALTRHKRAQVFVRGTDQVLVTPTAPTFDAETGVVTVPSQTGVVYFDGDTSAELTAGAQPALDPGATMEVEALPADGYFFPHNTDADWNFTRPLA